MGLERLVVLFQIIILSPQLLDDSLSLGKLLYSMISLCRIGFEAQFLTRRILAGLIQKTLE
jgi:hypothetical protein